MPRPVQSNLQVRRRTWYQLYYLQNIYITIKPRLRYLEMWERKNLPSLKNHTVGCHAESRCCWGTSMDEILATGQSRSDGTLPSSSKTPDIPKLINQLIKPGVKILYLCDTSAHLCRHSHMRNLQSIEHIPRDYDLCARTDRTNTVLNL